MGFNEKMYCMARPGITIKKWMDARGWSEGELSRRSKVPQPTIHRIVVGDSVDPRRSNLERIARAFGRNVEDLYDGNSEPSELTSEPTAPAVNRISKMVDELRDEVHKLVEHNNAQQN